MPRDGGDKECLYTMEKSGSKCVSISYITPLKVRRRRLRAILGTDTFILEGIYICFTRVGNTVYDMVVVGGEMVDVKANDERYAKRYVLSLLTHQSSNTSGNLEHSTKIE